MNEQVAKKVLETLTKQSQELAILLLKAGIKLPVIV